MVEMDTSSEEYYDLLDQIGAWEQKLEVHEPAKMKSRIEKTLMGLGFEVSDLERDTGEFSGGWQMRIALAKLLLKEPSLLLLDEPTNHLDIISQQWLEDYLTRYEGSLIIISHDRAFLDVVTNRTIHLSMGRLSSYSGNYSFYVKQSEADLETLRKKLRISKLRSNDKRTSSIDFVAT